MAHPLGKLRILVIEDEPDIRESFVGILEAEGYQVRGGADLTEGRAALEGFKPHLLLLDLGLPDGNGLEILEALPELSPMTMVVVITAETRVETAVQAMRKGARDYLEKPIGLDRLLTTVRLSLEEQGLRRENLELREQALERYSILGNSPAIRRLEVEVERVAQADLPVLITGENGTGKELVARHLHLLSDRYRHPFLATNCAAIPETLMESEFFGHVKGAFTGAERDRTGLFLQASHGTLFLDEIGEMPAALQARLLRVLQERQVSPLGSSEGSQVTCRFVAATNKDLEACISSGSFREDLYYRIRGLEIRVPPLRERREDIPLLANHFLEQAGGRRAEGLKLGEGALAWLAGQDWPGNVRQIQSLMQAAGVLVEKSPIEKEDLEPLMRPAPPSGASEAEGYFAIQSIKEFREEVEKEYLRRKLEEEGWNVSRTARRIGIRRTNLHERLKHHGLK